MKRGKNPSTRRKTSRNKSANRQTHSHSLECRAHWGGLLSSLLWNLIRNRAVLVVLEGKDLFSLFSATMLILGSALCFYFRASLLRKCWSQDPSQRPKPSEIVRILINNPEFVRASIEVPATTLLDNSVGSFDARKASTRARTGLGSPQSINSFRGSDQVSSTMNLTLT